MAPNVFSVTWTRAGASPIPGTAEVLPALAQLVAAFRGAGRPVVHVVRLYDGEDVDLVRRTGECRLTAETAVGVHQAAATFGIVR